MMSAAQEGAGGSASAKRKTSPTVEAATPRSNVAGKAAEFSLDPNSVTPGKGQRERLAPFVGTPENAPASAVVNSLCTTTAECASQFARKEPLSSNVAHFADAVAECASAAANDVADGSVRARAGTDSSPDVAAERSATTQSLSCLRLGLSHGSLSEGDCGPSYGAADIASSQPSAMPTAAEGLSSVLAVDVGAATRTMERTESTQVEGPAACSVPAAAPATTAATQAGQTVFARRAPVEAIVGRAGAPAAVAAPTSGADSAPATIVPLDSGLATSAAPRSTLTSSAALQSTPAATAAPVSTPATGAAPKLAPETAAAPELAPATTAIPEIAPASTRGTESGSTKTAIPAARAPVDTPGYFPPMLVLPPPLLPLVFSPQSTLPQQTLVQNPPQIQQPQQLQQQVFQMQQQFLLQQQQIIQQQQQLLCSAGVVTPAIGVTRSPRLSFSAIPIAGPYQLEAQQPLYQTEALSRSAEAEPSIATAAMCHAESSCETDYSKIFHMDRTSTAAGSCLFRAEPTLERENEWPYLMSSRPFHTLQQHEDVNAAGYMPSFVPHKQQKASAVTATEAGLQMQLQQHLYQCLQEVLEQQRNVAVGALHSVPAFSAFAAGKNGSRCTAAAVPHSEERQDISAAMAACDAGSIGMQQSMSNSSTTRSAAASSRTHSDSSCLSSSKDFFSSKNERHTCHGSSNEHVCNSSVDSNWRTSSMKADKLSNSSSDSRSDKSKQKSPWQADAPAGNGTEETHFSPCTENSAFAASPGSTAAPKFRFLSLDEAFSSAADRVTYARAFAQVYGQQINLWKWFGEQVALQLQLAYLSAAFTADSAALGGLSGNAELSFGGLHREQPVRKAGEVVESNCSSTYSSSTQQQAVGEKSSAAAAATATSETELKAAGATTEQMADLPQTASKSPAEDEGASIAPENAAAATGEAGGEVENGETAGEAAPLEGRNDEQRHVQAWQQYNLGTFVRLLLLLFLFDARREVYTLTLLLLVLHLNGVFDPILTWLRRTSHPQPLEVTLARLRRRHERRPLQILQRQQQRLREITDLLSRNRAARALEQDVERQIAATAATSDSAPQAMTAVEAAASEQAEATSGVKRCLEGSEAQSNERLYNWEKEDAAHEASNADAAAPVDYNELPTEAYESEIPSLSSKPAATVTNTVSEGGGTVAVAQTTATDSSSNSTQGQLKFASSEQQDCNTNELIDSSSDWRQLRRRLLESRVRAAAATAVAMPATEASTAAKPAATAAAAEPHEKSIEVETSPLGGERNERTVNAESVAAAASSNASAREFESEEGVAEASCVRLGGEGRRERAAVRMRMRRSYVERLVYECIVMFILTFIPFWNPDPRYLLDGDDSDDEEDLLVQPDAPAADDD